VKLSIVIPCKDDKKVTSCVASIDASVEVVIVFNGSPVKFIKQVKEKLKNKKAKNIKYIELPEANLAWALEKGAWASKNDWVLFMDSDCLFEKGAVEGFYQSMLKGNPDKEVYKGQVIFDNSGNVMSRIIAKSRQHHTAEELTAYKPPLALSKKIARKVGGYLFNERLIWREDADLDNRLRIARIKILPVPSGTIHHGALDLKTDLRSTLRYGVGGAIAKSLGIKLTDVPRSFFSTWRSQGVIPALYMLFRNRFYTAGYYYQKAKYLTEKLNSR
jgi:glycosyltransferase involved in cell wall biosynthesis